MSLRIVGNQLLQTAPGALLTGASTASLSLWIRVNPGCNVANSNGVEIFGDSGGKLSATLSGTGNLQLRWSSYNGNANSSSSYALALIPGTNYHLASTWQSGTQKYFVNGVQVFADTQAGSIGVLGDSTAHPYQLGSSSAGTDVTLDEPTLWVGYVLSSQDVLNLRDRIVQPRGIVPSSIALAWSLAGSDGIAAKIGDPGLADGSKTGLNLSSIVAGAPAFQGGVLPYSPPVKASVAPSGESIVLICEDGSGNPINVSAVQSGNDVQTLSLSGTPAGSSLRLTYNGQTTAPIAITSIPQPEYALVTLTVVPNHPLQIAVTWPNPNGYGPSRVHFEFFDATLQGTLLGSADADYRVDPSGFTDSGVPWQLLGTITPPSSTVVVRQTAVSTGFFYVDAIRTQDNTTSAVTYYDDADPTSVIYGPNTVQVATFLVAFRSQARFTTGTGIGSVYQVHAADIQSALLALSSVAPNGVTVTAPGNSLQGPWTIMAGGSLANAPVPTATCSDPVFAISHTGLGGVMPSISINGGSAVPLINPVWGVGLPAGYGGYQSAPYLPFVLYPLRQAAAAQRIFGCGQQKFHFIGPVSAIAVSGSYSIDPFISVGANASLLFPFQGVPSGTYQFAATWPVITGASTSAQFLIQDQNGSTLATFTIDQSVAPHEFTQYGVSWKTIGSYSVPPNSPINSLTLAITNAGTSGIVAADAVQMNRTSPDDSVKIQATDFVTLTIPAGILTTANGAVPTVTNQAVTNLVGGSLLPAFASVPKTLQIGYNVESDSAGSSTFLYSNLAHRYQEQGNVVARDANGYPTKMSGPFALITLGGSRGSDDGGKGFGVNCLPNGHYTVKWTGDGVRNAVNCDLIGSDGSYSASEVTSTVGASGYSGSPSAANSRVFHLQAGKGAFSPTLLLRLTSTDQDSSDGNSWISLQNLEVYPPDPSDPTGMTPWGLNQTPPRFHPSWLIRMGNVRSIRAMDQLNTNNNTIADFSHFKPQSFLTYNFPQTYYSIPISKVQSYSGDPYFDTAKWVVLRITTSVPHGLSNGMAGTMTGAGTAVLSNGTTMSLDQGTFGIHVQSPTEFLAPIGYGLNGVTMTNALTPTSATYSGQIGNMTPLADIVAQCNVANANLWFNVPTVATDACIDSIAQYIAAHLKPGLKVRVEYANECWNIGFVTYVYCQIKSYKINGVAGNNDYAPWYVRQAKNCHDRFLAAFTTAGRASDVIRVLGSNIDSGTTAGLCNLANSIGMQFDELATAPYQANIVSSEPTLMPIADLMSVGQGLDLFELNTLYGGYFQICSSIHKSVLQSKGFGAVRVVHYEGAIQNLTPLNSTLNAQLRSHAMNRNPRMFHITLSGILQGLQDAGSTMINFFVLGGGPVSSGGLPQEWATWFGWNQQPGTGDPILDAINISDPEANDQIKSEIGGAHQLWSSLATLPSRSKRLVAGRNGTVKAIGLPRGAYKLKH